ncbi:MAG TPA: LacI family DNA-binding transcriptional regulator [Amycolatopsis sp.]|uniref:LacI family DNA-binding transcriptional regulator n=1 Tax=Amycolatopsis sp. TaxID=37632 RepID=UPI002B45D0E9|nr:LacI family DNA-binding transcriptional regulator [Amycolatopsis sp.]HKS44390.1 LacI family DNA-binding transcriptional regulator [Amycolatopsis sp.]
MAPRPVRSGRPTLEDVAAKAGVSRSTASRVLNEESYVSPKARDAVLAAAQALDYSPNQAARSLVTRRTGAVALLLSEPESKVLDDPYFAAVVRAGFRELARVGSQMLVMFVDSADDVPVTARFLGAGHVDGALVFAPHRDDPLPAALKALPLPIVFGGRAGTTRGLHVIDFDNRGGARLAVRHLVSLGRRRIATITGPRDHPAAQDRHGGWRKELAEHGIDPDGLAEDGEFTFDGGEHAMTKLLERAPDLDAVFAASDPMAAGALRALRAAKRRVPRDVAIIGFDDNPTLAPAMSPPLSSVHQDPAEQVREMVAVLMRLAAGEDVRPGRRALPVSLVLRESTPPVRP